MKIYKWVPATGDSAAAITNRKLSKPQLKVEDEDASRTVPDVSAENSREGLGSESGAGISRLRGNFNINEDSNTGFSETGFDSDSNQAFEGRRYQTGAGESTDFSALRQAELDESTDEPPAKRLKDM
uniref:Uncharacterized protein n=1 Tax=Plectus sambesii TaxID=2011161 RepID=A0A914V1D8_9BILA